MSISIKDLEIGKSAKITEVGGEGALRQHQGLCAQKSQAAFS